MSSKGEPDTTFGDRLKKIREQRELSQTELAASAKLQPAAIGHFEKGRRKPSFANLRQLAKALSVSIDYLSGNGEPKTVFRGADKLSTENTKQIQEMIDFLNHKQGQNE